MYLLGSDNLNYEKGDKFIIYQGSHGDRGADKADVILPSPAFTEQDGLYQTLREEFKNVVKQLSYWKF